LKIISLLERLTVDKVIAKSSTPRFLKRNSWAYDALSVHCRGASSLFVPN